MAGGLEWESIYRKSDDKMGHCSPVSVCTPKSPDSKSRLLPQLCATQRKATHQPHPALPGQAPSTYRALTVGRGPTEKTSNIPVLSAASRRQGARSPPRPRPRPRSRWRLNLQRAETGSVDPQAGMESLGPGARCPVQEQRARWERKRACTAWELLETERRYHEQLGLVATYFVGILRAKGTVRPPERQALFGPWELIYGASQELLPYLEGGRWGQGLEGFCPHLKLYTQYAANAERSRTTLQEQLKNKRFRKFVQLQEGRPEFGGLQLQDLLPLPLQRLQQYENLAVALAENTGPNSPDHEQLTRAARLISETAQRVHTIGQKQKNDQHLQRVQGLLSGRQAKGLTSGRWFLRQGWLLVVPPRGEPRPRMFFLFSDALLMAKPRPPLHLLQSGTFACQALYPMAECQLHRVFGHSGGPCGGLLSLSFPHEKLLLMSTDQEELLGWYHSLTLAISNQKN